MSDKNNDNILDVTPKVCFNVSTWHLLLDSLNIYIGIRGDGKWTESNYPKSFIPNL